MAYLRKRRYTRRKYGSSKARKITKRSARPSRYTVKTRRYTRKPQMSKRRILNITTVKKRDNMLTTTNMLTVGGAPAAAYSPQPAVIGPITTNDVTVGDVNCLLWCATARDLTDAAGNANLRVNEAVRTSTTPYMVGLRESVEVQLSSGLPWQWRRICFTFRGPIPNVPATSTFNYYAELSDGYRRVVNNLDGNRNQGGQYWLYELLFAGQNSSDWNDPMTAKTDQTRVDIKYDRTRTLATGNDRGMIRKYNFYHAMNKTLAYNDDETGATERTSYYSVNSKVGMGDFYVVDLIRSRNGGNAQTDNMSFNPSATLYWHEK